MEYKLTPGSQEQLDRRIEVGRACIEEAGGPAPGGEDYDGWLDDYETAATDAISDILTAVLGPRGYFRDGKLVGGEGIVSQAEALLDRSLRSWEGDAEDYDVEDDAPQLVPAYHGPVRRLVLEISEADLAAHLDESDGDEVACIRDFGTVVPEPTFTPSEELADAWRRYQAGEDVTEAELRALDEDRADWREGVLG